MIMNNTNILGGLELDKRLNQQSNFSYPSMDARRQLRLLRISGDPATAVSYSLEAVFADDLPATKYQALSYTWGSAPRERSDLREVVIDHRPFFVRRNLFDFLQRIGRDTSHGAGDGSCNLFFIDAVCINQLDNAEREAQVRLMSRVFYHADCVIAWLGRPACTADWANVHALSRAVSVFGSSSGPPQCGAMIARHTLHDMPEDGGARLSSIAWTAEQWAGLSYLSHHAYWSRVWIVQEILLAARMVVWCGPYTFPLSMLGGPRVPMSPFRHAGFSPAGQPSSTEEATVRHRTPASAIITHRLRHVPVSNFPGGYQDWACPGAEIGTLEEMLRGLRRRPEKKVVEYQSRIPDPLHELFRAFGRRTHCTHPADHLYGFLGILREPTRRRIEVDYGRGKEFAFYQALKVGTWELLRETPPGQLVLFRRDWTQNCVSFYCDVRDTFGVGQDVGMAVWKDVMRELDFSGTMDDALGLTQWGILLDWDRGVAVGGLSLEVTEMSKVMGKDSSKENMRTPSKLHRFHLWQHRVFRNWWGLGTQAL